MTEPAYDVLMLAPGAEKQSPHRGTPTRQTYAELRTYVSRPFVNEKKDQNGGLVLGRFGDGIRRLTHFEGTTLLGLDYDAGDKSASDLFDMMGSTLHLVYSTHSSRPEKPKSRGIFFLDREIDLATHKRIIWAVYARSFERGFDLDPACKDATRWFFSPVVHPDRVSEFQVFASDDTAPLLRVDGLLELADRLDAAEADRVAERVRRAPPAADSARGKPAYQAAAIRSAIDRLYRATEGQRHEVLNVEAYSLARLGLTEHEIGAALIPPFLVVAGPAREREAVRTVADACKARGA